MAWISELKNVLLVNNLILWMSLFCVSFTALAQKRFAVETTQEVSPEIKKKYPQVQFKTPKDKPKADVPRLSERDKYFTSLGLGSELGSMDEADKDILFYRLKNSSVSKLKNWYPKFPQTVWKKLESK